MKRNKAMIQRLLKEMIQDKRTLALIFLAPLVILFLMNIIFNTNQSENLKIATYQVPTEIVDAMPDKVDVVKFKDEPKDKDQTIRNKDYAAFIKYDKQDKTLSVDYSNTNPSETSALKTILRSILIQDKMKTLVKNQQALLKQLPKQVQQQITTQQKDQKEISIKNHYLYGNSDSTFFTKIAPLLIGFFVFLFVFLISGMGLLKERTTGTLQRILVTPIRRTEIISGYVISYGIIAILQTLLVVFFSIKILDLEVVGSLWLVVLINVMIALVALTMGLFISTFASSQFQMMQFIPIVIVPQIFFSGIIPLDTLPSWVQVVGKFLPLSYGGDALSDVIMKGYTFNQILPDISVLAIFIIVFFILNVIGLRKYRKV